MDMFEAETGRLPEGLKSVSDQENTVVQQVQIRKEHLPYDVCPRCGCGIGWMKCRFHEGHALLPRAQAWLCLRGCHDSAKAQQCSSVGQGDSDILVRGVLI